MKDGETGFFVPAQDPEALAEKLRLLFVEHDLRASFGERAVTYAQGFQWETITSQIASVYQSVLQKGMHQSSFPSAGSSND